MNNTNSNSTFIKSYDNKYYINVNHKKKGQYLYFIGTQ